MQLYHNPRCSKSRQALALLEGKDVQVINYVEHPLSVPQLQALCKLLHIEPTQLLRTKEDIYKELVKQHGKPDNTTALAWMHEHPKIMERPIFVHNNKAVIGRPPQEVLKIL